MDNDRGLSKVIAIAKKKNIKGNIEISDREGKRFKITLPNGKIIHFGAYPYAKGTFLDHSDESIRRAWRARHKRIIGSDNRPVYLNKMSPSYYSWNLLW